ncbi:MAG: ribosome small subunit-dependent GTPase A [Lachnospiraceae bacterium]|nr:ribosome small subunit-dependent GTPase A [Lachnospiraceae bacterium]
MINLKEYGYREDKIPPDGLKPGRITAVHRERYELIGADGPAFGKLKSGVYYSTGEETFPTVGDFILYRPITGGDCQIVKTLPRFSYFARLDPNPNGGKQQAVAANIDVAFIMSSLNQDFNISRLERYLTLARQNKAKPVIILTKTDLTADYANEALVAAAVAGDTPVIPVSVVDGTGLDEVKKHLLPGLTVVFIGMSGVGKSSLLNALMGDEVMNVGAIRDDDSRGRHTTTHRQLFKLPGGAMVIDTPGMRTMGMWEADEGLSETFADIESLGETCRFSDCCHETEPGCAIHAAIAAGDITKQHWQNYLKLKKEAAYSERKADILRIKAAKDKMIALEERSRKKHRQ